MARVNDAQTKITQLKHFASDIGLAGLRFANIYPSKQRPTRKKYCICLENIKVGQAGFTEQIENQLQ